jgi:hypothetical protein
LSENLTLKEERGKSRVFLPNPLGKGKEKLKKKKNLTLSE